MPNDANQFVTCGMYSFTAAQQSAWRQLFERFFELSKLAPGSVELRFDHAPEALLEPGMWFGHTCGYPLMTRLQTSLSPFSLPLFDVQGTDGKLYSSRIIVAADSSIQSIEDSRGRVAAMNNLDSNSGMNVLRHAVAEVHHGAEFFARVLTTGGHFDSLRAVAEGRADIAAIDCVSYRLIEDWQPELCAGLRVIANSVSTCGLPLVMPNSAIAEADCAVLTARLNQALLTCPATVSETLHLSGFAEVRLENYESILEVERYAIDRGYPELA